MRLFTIRNPPRRCRLALLASRVQAGFPSPAEDYVEGKLDLNEHLIRHPAATFFLRVSGTSMTGAGIFPNDLLIVDRSLKPQAGDIVIAVLDGELTVKRLVRDGEGWSLQAENKNFPSIPLSAETDFTVWGVVSNAIHQFRRR